MAVNVAEVELAATVTDAPTGNAALLLDRPTAVPPGPAAWVRVTVQVVDDPELTLVGLQLSADTSVGATRLTEVF